jgi:hypothetical protein
LLDDAVGGRVDVVVEVLGHPGLPVRVGCGREVGVGRGAAVLGLEHRVG